MDSKKLLVLLVAFIIYTNYENYFKVDIPKLHRQVATLKANIQREEEITKAKHTESDLLVDYDKITLSGKKYTYSKAMGEMQNQITDSSKDTCTIKSIKWAQSPTSKEWFDKLRMDVFLNCTPRNLFILTNKLKDKNTIYTFESFKVYKAKNRDKKIQMLGVQVQLVGYRTHK